MLKHCILAAFSTAALSVEAQMALRRPEAQARAERDAIQLSLGRQQGSVPHGSAKAASVIQLGGAANLYTFLLTGQNQVAYNPDINTVIFQHRQDPADHGNLGGSGSLRVDFSTDGGATWNVDSTLVTPNMFAGSAVAVGTRYPNATLYNPTGNTDPANAYVVSHGPALEASTGTNIWGWIVEASTKLDGSNATDAYVDHFGDTTSFHPYGLCANPNGDAWSVSTRYLVANDPLNYTVFNVNKGVFNSGTNGFDWSVQGSISPDFFMDADSTPIYGTHNMAFSPDGLVGYVVVIGKENDNLAQGPAPLLWKTTDAGATWNQLPNHDFSTDAAFADVLTPAFDSGLPRPWFSDMDLVVDHTGALHIFSEVLSGYTASPDSQGFIFTDLTTQYLFHTSTTDGVNWWSRMVDGVYGADFSLPSSDPANIPMQGNRPQASRTADGTRVFFTWNSSGLSEPENYIPDVWGIGHNVDTQLGTAPKNLTLGTDAESTAWFHTVSPVSISNGSEHQFELPIVFAQHNGDALGHADFFYIRGVGFDDAEFVVGMEDIGPELEVEVYPNPGAGRFTISGTHLAGAQLMLTDAMGRAVLQATATSSVQEVDLGRMAAGTYQLMVRSDQGTTTRKVMVY